jgi:hypothetical protein
VTITRAQFVEEFAEFARAAPALVDAKLAEAYRRTPERIWGDLTDDGAKYLAAHLVAQSPYARELKLVDKDGQTRYGMQREHLAIVVSSGFRVTD